MTQLLQPAPVWYPDPARTAELRYWDGTTWTAHVHPPQPPVPTWTQPVTPTPRASWARRLVVPLALLLVFLLVLPVALYQWRLHHRPSAATPVGKALDPQAAAAALRVGGRPGQQLITPAQAGTVLAALWPLRERAITSGDTEAVRALESGSAEWGDVIRARGREGLRSKPAGYASATFFVPRQTSYPGRFLAFVATSQRDGAPLAEAMVFVRASATAPWTLDLDTAWTLGSGAENLPAPRVDAQGYVVAPSASLDELARRAPSRLVAYWQQAKDQGRTPPLGVFAPGAWTTDRAAYLAEHPNGTTQSNGLPGVTRVSLGSSPFRTFLQADGADIACGVVWTTSVNTRGSRGWPYQDDDRSNWGPEVAPGLYREMRTRYQWQTCFFVPPAGPVRVLGGQGLTEALTTGIPLS
jgi:hypothetical protein